MKKTILKKIRGKFYPTVIDVEENPIVITPELRISELKTFLRDSDYVANKITEAIAEYLTTNDDSELNSLLNEYSEVLNNRKLWRKEINELI